jgi:hypothetical protein
VASPHDALFRRVFADAEAAAALLRWALPAPIANALDLERLAARPTAQVDAGLTTAWPDLAFDVPLRASERRAVLILEHKSFVDREVLARLLGYGHAVWLDADRDGEGPLPTVVFVVVHHGRRPWPGARLSAPGDGYPDDGASARLELALAMQPLLVDLATFTEEQLAACPLPALARLTLLLLQVLRGAGATDSEAALQRWASLLREVRDGPSGPADLETVGSYVLEATELGAERLRAVFARLLGPESGDAVMSTAEKLRAEGRIEGRIEGRNQGKLELLLRILQRRFGNLPEAAVEHLRACSEADLDAVGERVLDARSLDEALGR